MEVALNELHAIYAEKEASQHPITTLKSRYGADNAIATIQREAQRLSQEGVPFEEPYNDFMVALALRLPSEVFDQLATQAPVAWNVIAQGTWGNINEGKIYQVEALLSEVQRGDYTADESPNLTEHQQALLLAKIQKEFGTVWNFNREIFSSDEEVSTDARGRLQKLIDEAKAEASPSR
jgi:hypothetical protein